MSRLAKEANGFVPWVTIGVVSATWVAFSIQFLFGIGAYRWVQAAVVVYPADLYLREFGTGWILYFTGLAGYWLAHGDWAHILQNSAAVLLMGYFVERRFVSGGFGRWNYLALSLGLSVLAGESISIAWSINGFVWGKSSGALGMSGIAYGMVGTALAISTRLPFWVPAVAFYDLVGLADQVALHSVYGDSLSRPDIAHMTAAIAGVSLGATAKRRWLAKEDEERPRLPVRVRLIGAASYIFPPAVALSLATRRRDRAFSRSHGLQAAALWGGLLAYFATLIFVNKHIVPIASSEAGYWLVPFAVHVAVAVLLALTLHSTRGGKPARWFSERPSRGSPAEVIRKQAG